jgi:hypothetical protein
MDDLVPVAFFVTIIALARSYADYRVRAKLIQANASPETARLVVSPPGRGDLFTDLKWGIVSIFIGLGVIAGSAVAAAQPPDSALADPLRYGIIIISGGVGLLGYHAIASRLARRAETTPTARGAAPAPAVR